MLFEPSDVWNRFRVVNGFDQLHLHHAGRRIKTQMMPSIADWSGVEPITIGDDLIKPSLASGANLDGGIERRVQIRRPCKVRASIQRQSNTGISVS